MNKQVFTGKTEEEAINKAMITLQETRDQLIVCNVDKQSGGLFKSPKVEVEIVTRRDVIDYIKELLKKIASSMGVKVQMESKVREGIPSITLYSDEDAILIGKNGRTLNALVTVVRQSVLNLTGEHFHFQLDVAEYKKKRENNLIRLAKKTAREVAHTKISVKLEAMNSYERRIIHTALVDYSKVTTVSEGEEPNRCVVIKPVEEEN